MTPQIQAVTFDVGGTLIEPWPSVGHVYAEVAARHGVTPATPEELSRRFGAAWRAAPDFRYTRAEWSALVDRTFAGLCPRPPSETFFDELYDRFTEPGAWRVHEDVLPTLLELSGLGLRLGVISNWDDRLVPLLGRLDLLRHFEVVTVSCDTGFRKPARQIFEAALRGLNLPAAAVLHVGDNFEMDLQGAQAAGMAAVQVERGPGPAVDGQLKSLRQLSTWVTPRRTAPPAPLGSPDPCAPAPSP